MDELSSAYAYVDLEAVDEDLLCSLVCLHPLENPVEHSKCENLICLSCLERAGCICPVCRVKVDVNDPTQVSRPSRRERNRLDKIPVRCSSCQSEVARGSMEHHSLHSCGQPCPQQCGQSFPRSEMKSHESTCPNVLIPCPGQAFECPVEVKRSEMDNHIASCSVVALVPALQYLQTRLQAQQTQLQTQQTQLQAQRAQLQTQQTQLHAQRDQLSQLHNQVTQQERKLPLGQCFVPVVHGLRIIKKQLVTKARKNENKLEQLLNRMDQLETQLREQQIRETSDDRSLFARMGRMFYRSSQALEGDIKKVEGDIARVTRKGEEIATERARIQRAIKALPTVDDQQEDRRIVKAYTAFIKQALAPQFEELQSDIGTHDERFSALDSKLSRFESRISILEEK